MQSAMTLPKPPVGEYENSHSKEETVLEPATTSVIKQDKKKEKEVDGEEMKEEKCS